MSERVHPWQECNGRLEARAAARRWRRRHQHQDAGRCHAGGHAKVTARTAPGTPSTARTAYTSLLAYQNLPSSPNRMPALWSCRPVRAAHLGEPRCSTPFLHRVISGAPAPTASRCFRPVHPPLLTPHSQDHQVFDQHKFGLSTALRPRFPSRVPASNRLAPQRTATRLMNASTKVCA